jgi:hypothetical membrane protein
MAVPVWFAAVYLILAGLRPEYSHLTKAISELGSLDAPRAWVWNLGGYIIPGAVVSLLGFGLGRHFVRQAGIRLASWALIASGLLMALSGVFPGDFENRTSFTMLMHSLGSLGSFVAFLLGAFALPSIWRRSAPWRPLTWPALALVLGSILTGFLRSGEAPGLGQRLGFGCFFLWVALVGYGLYRNAGNPTQADPA